MMISYHFDERRVMVCSFCGEDAMVCNIWNELGRCVERAAWDIVRAAASSV